MLNIPHYHVVGVVLTLEAVHGCLNDFMDVSMTRNSCCSQFADVRPPFLAEYVDIHSEASREWMISV